MTLLVAAGIGPLLAGAAGVDPPADGTAHGVPAAPRASGSVRRSDPDPQRAGCDSTSVAVAVAFARTAVAVAKIFRICVTAGPGCRVINSFRTEGETCI